MMSESFERDRLSARENEILEYAIEGMTDIQIAQRIDISQSTVNSYWVRIRGKLGQLSRTELVALALKQQSRNDLAKMLERNQELERNATEFGRLSRDYRNAEVYHAALDAMPEAIFVCCDRGLIRYANARLEKLFGYDHGALVDQSILVLLPTRQHAQAREEIQDYLQNPGPLRLGIDRVLYARRSDGREFRVVLLLDARPISSGHIVTGVVRDFVFVSEIDTRRSYVSGAAKAA